MVLAYNYVHTDLTGFGSSLSTGWLLNVTLTIPNISSEIKDPNSPTRPATVLGFAILTSLFYHSAAITYNI